MQKIKDIVRHELIGLNVEIADSKNKSLIGIKGKIIDETKNMLTIEKDTMVKRVIKEQVVLDLSINDKIVRVDGRLLIGRPEDRIKKIRKLR